MSLARLLAVRAAVRASPGEPEGTGGVFLGFPHALVGGAQATLQLRLQPLQMAGRTDKSFQNRAVIFDFFPAIFETTGFGKCSSPADRTRRALRWG